MIFSNDTFKTLDYFSKINPSIAFKPGSVIRTISPQKTVMAKATVSEEFPTSAGVYDLSRFLSTVTLLDKPDIQFEEDKFVIKAGRTKVNYTYAAESMIVTPPEKDIVLPEAECTIDVKWEDIQNVVKAASVLQLGEISFKSDGSTVSMSAVDSKNPTADNYNVNVADVDNISNFDMMIKVENLKLIPVDYQISLSSKGMAHFKSEKVEYWIALEAN